MGVDSKTKLIHSAVATAANVADSAVMPDLLHGKEAKVWGDQAYRGQSAAIHEAASALAGGARVSDHEAAVRLREGSLPRAGQERQPAVCHLRTGQPLHRPSNPAAAGAGRVRSNAPVGALASRQRPQASNNLS